MIWVEDVKKLAQTRDRIKKQFHQKRRGAIWNQMSVTLVLLSLLVVAISGGCSPKNKDSIKQEEAISGTRSDAVDSSKNLKDSSTNSAIAMNKD